MPVRSAFSRASERASSDTSIAVTRAPGCSSASASATAPDPAPTSRTRGASSPSSSVRQRSTRVSVSGRGMSARPSTRSVRRRKPHSPRTYWSGSPSALRRTSARASSSSATDSGRSRCMYSSTRSSPRACARSRSASRRGRPEPRAARWSVDRRRTSPMVTSHGCLECPPAVLRLERLGELLEVPVQDLVEAVHGVLDAVVGEAVLGEVVGADLLCALAGADLRAPRRGDLRLLALALRLVQPRAEDPHRLLLVLELRLLVLHRDDDPGRQVRDPDGRVGGVDRLAAGARRAVHVDFQLLVLDLDLDVLGLRHHRDGRGRRVDPPLRLRRRDTLDAVRAALPLEHGERAVPLHREDGLLDASALVLAPGQGLRAKAPALGVALQHARDLARPERRLIAADALPHLDDHVLAV